MFLSLMSYSLNTYLNYIKKTIDGKDPSWMSGWNKNCVTESKKNNACCKEYVRSGDFLFDSPTYLKMDVAANFYFSYICIL